MFNVDSSTTLPELIQQFSLYGDVKDIHDHPRIRGCVVVEYYDTRHAALAYQSINRTAAHASMLPVVNESTSSQPQEQRAMPFTGMRNVPSSHALDSVAETSAAAPTEVGFQGPRSWDSASTFLQEQAAALLRRKGRPSSCHIIAFLH